MSTLGPAPSPTSDGSHAANPPTAAPGPEGPRHVVLRRAIADLPRWARRSGAAMAAAIVVLLATTITGFALNSRNLSAWQVIYQDHSAAMDAEIRSVEGELETTTNERDALLDEVAGIREREQEADAREADLDARTAELDQREQDLEQREAAVGEAEAQQAANQFGTGTFLVGVDIEPGTYRADGSDTCYWARLSGVGGTIDDIIANHIGAGSQTVSIRSGDYAFESSGCGTWTKIG